jgi:hypothetical protein
MGSRQARPGLWPAREILRREGLNVSSLCPEALPNEVSYADRSLIWDASIACDDAKGDLLKYVLERYSEEMLKYFYGDGAELVSRKLLAPSFDQDGSSHPSLREVSKYIVAHKGRDSDSFACLPN